MLIYIPKKEHGHLDHGWLDTYHHFSFGEYYNPQKRNFGVLRVLNDDTVKPGSGFPFHPHYDMEIFTYVVDGTLAHKDSMQNETVLHKGDVQLLSTGIGAFHSEANSGESNARYIQLWITPTRLGLIPNYQFATLDPEDKKDKWSRVASHQNGPAGLGPILVNQDVNVYVIETAENFNFSVTPGRKVYLNVIDGDVTVNNKVKMSRYDALMAQDEILTFVPSSKTHVILVEMGA